MLRSRRGRGNLARQHQGSPGTWEVQPFPIVTMPDATGYRLNNRPGWGRGGPASAERTDRTQTRVSPNEGNEVRRNERMEFGAAHSTTEAGEPSRGILWRKGAAGTTAPLEGKMAETPSFITVST